MKIFIFSLCLIFSVNAAQLHAKYSLQDCLELAADNSEKIAIADLQVLIESEKVDEAWGAVIPKLTAQGDYIAAGEPTRFLKKHKKANAKASLLVPIYNFGGYANAITAQEKLYESANYRNSQVRQEVIYLVTQAYFRLLEAQKIESVVSDSIASLKEQHRIAQDFYSQGLVQENEALLVEVQLAQREQDHLQAKQNIALTQMRLNRLMGICQAHPIEIEDTLEDFTWNTNLATILCEAKSCNADLIACQLQVEAAYYTYKAEKGALYPAIYAYTDYSTTNDYALPYTHGVNVGLGMQVSLYDASARAKIRRKEKEWMEAQQHCQSLQEDLELKVRSAFLQVETAASKIPVAIKSIKLAKENLKSTRDQFQEGLVTSYDMLSDEERLTQARSNYYQALYDFHRAKSELDYASGICQEGEES